MKRGGWIQRRTPLAPISRKRRATLEARKRVVEFVHARDKTCRFPEAAARSNVAATLPVGCSGRLDVHEIVPRSVHPGAELKPALAILLCRRHHDWVGDNPHTAWLLGLHKFSWESAA